MFDGRDSTIMALCKSASDHFTFQDARMVPCASSGRGGLVFPYVYYNVYAPINAQSPVVVSWLDVRIDAIASAQDNCLGPISEIDQWLSAVFVFVSAFVAANERSASQGNYCEIIRINEMFN